LTDYWMDRYEVTNRQFKEFVERGGYRKRNYWKHAFLKSGRAIPWEQALADFHDATGWPGPATWELGEYPRGQDNYPVTGVSWYEAAAYAEFAGKSLPTIYHWTNAVNPLLAELSQFAGLEGGKCFGMSEGYRKVFTTTRAELRQSGELFARL